MPAQQKFDLALVHFEPNHIYHVYNRGNNKVPIFFSEQNYFYLLKKIRVEWLPYCDILCYCLMPNHFHFMLVAKPEGCETVYLKGKDTDLQLLSKAIGKTLSSYTQAINIQNNITGNLFQKKTKAKCLTDVSLTINQFPTTEYLINCFYYIHFNPLEARLVKQLGDWPYSSWLDYTGLRNGDLCNKEKAIELLGLASFDLLMPNNFVFNKDILERIW